MMLFLTFALTLIINYSTKDVMAKESLHAHDHGHASLSLVVDKNNLEIALEAPAESLLGFEHAPQNSKEKNLWSKAQETWNKQIEKIFILPEVAVCSLKKSSLSHMIDKHKKSSHSEIEGEATLVCQQNLSGKKMTVVLKKYFPRMKNIKTEVISEQSKIYHIKSESFEITF